MESLNDNKFATILLLLISFSIVLNAQSSNSIKPTKYTDPGVVIGNVTWATRNVDYPGTFAVKPESPGMFYQWGSKVGWSVTNSMANSNGEKNWVDYNSTDEKWTPFNDPCPPGWRLPAEYELAGLIDSGNNWIYNYNNTGTAGCLLGTLANRIFVPAAGVRYYSNDKTGLLGYSNTDAGIWGNGREMCLRIEEEKVQIDLVNKNTGLNIRCVKGKKDATMSTTEDKGVTIAGIVWATRNVDIPGTFAASPDSKGMLYKWNQCVGWSANDPIVNSNGGRTWDKSTHQGAAWMATNDPCPAGWRVPTLSELENLKDTPNRYLVNGRLFGSFPNQIFLPFVGERNGFTNGELYYLDNGLGAYASATRTYITDYEELGEAYGQLVFTKREIFLSKNWRDNAISVRCVKKQTQLRTINH